MITKIELEKIFKELGRAVFEKSLSDLSADRRKKKHSQN